MDLFLLRKCSKISVFIFVLIIITALKNTRASTFQDDTPSQPPELEKLPFCGNEDQKDISRRMLFVTTLDGKLSALDISDRGTLKWSVATNPGPLLSSSIHRLELTNNGQWVRMIPSLSGGLYKFDGETIEPISITADHLLSASFKFSDDLVISGGKETRSYGISSRNGKIVYECSMLGCRNVTDIENQAEEHGKPKHYEIKDEHEHDPLIDDIIVIRRQTQTVRAIEPRTGGERWNFSVGHHELDVIKPENCHERPYTELEKSLHDIEIKVIVPEGIICAIKKQAPNVVLWKYKFDHPIVSAWKSNNNDKLYNLDLFTYSNWAWDQDEMPINYNHISPSVYVGMFNKQLYIQESNQLKKIMQTKIQNYDYLKTTDKSYPKIPWKPFPATSSALALIEDDSKELNHENQNESPSVTALSVLYASEYVNGNGFYLYTSSDLNKSQSGLCDKQNSSNLNDNEEFVFEDDYTPAKIIIVSLWFWWKEILVISLTTALVLNVLLSHRLTNKPEVVIVERHVEIKIPVTAEGNDYLKKPNSQRSISESSISDSFTSRFLTDFDMVQCLGKGGFGVVFEAKNKLDDCNYAIKRIILPNRQESRERVMREVKTLAHCEHQNIVRYFQAWVETPPPGWQENEDKIWMSNEALSHSIEIDSPSELSPPRKRVFTEVINKQNQELDSWISNLNTNECINFDDNNRKSFFNDCNMSDSFIEFREDTANQLNDTVFKNNVNCNDSFKIEFKDQSKDKCELNNISDNDSFKIEFINPKLYKYSANNNSYLNSFENQCLSNTEKSHEKDNYNSVSKNNDFSFTDSNNRLNTSFNKVKTHRRPLSLDLTNREHSNFFKINRMYLYIQMQLCKKQSLKDWLKLSDLDVRQNEIVPIFRQIVEGVEYVHVKGLIHRDLKPGNIFFSLDGQIKIGDFGLVTDMSDIPNTPCDNKTGLPSYIKHTDQVGTHLYMSPEQLQGCQYNYKVDIYSLGLIFFELLVVFGTEMERIEILRDLRMSKFPKNFFTSFPDEYKLLKMMLSQSPNERPTTMGIRSRPPLGNTNINSDCHFELPPRRRDSQLSVSSSNGSNSDTKYGKT